MLTPRDIENPARKSGYDHVSTAGGKGSGHGGGKPWMAIYVCRPPGIGERGPRRATPLEAAQDYCDFMNGMNAVPNTLNKANHAAAPKSDKAVHPKRAEAYRLLREADADEGDDPSGYVYCISDGEAVKVGKSKGHPQGRLKGIQTGNKRVCTLLGFREVNDRHAAEASLHARFKKYQPDNYVGEWFTPAQEILNEFGIKTL